MTGPFKRCELTGFGDGLAIGDEATVDVLLVCLDRLGDKRLFLSEGHLLPPDQIQISAAEAQTFCF